MGGTASPSSTTRYLYNHVDQNLPLTFQSSIIPDTRHHHNIHHDKVRVADLDRCDSFLDLWEGERCKMIEMSCEQHDEFSANSQFITHLIGRILWQQDLVPTPIDTKGFQTVLNLVENTCSDSFDLFFGLYYYNEHAGEHLKNIREALARVERQLAAREAYLAAMAEVSSGQRSALHEDVKTLMREAMLDLQQGGGSGAAADDETDE